MKCSDCAYKQKRNHLKKGMLECRLGPPSCSYGEDIKDQNRALWPVVRDIDWCGSFECKGE